MTHIHTVLQIYPSACLNLVQFRSTPTFQNITKPLCSISTISTQFTAWVTHTKTLHPEINQDPDTQTLLVSCTTYFLAERILLSHDSATQTEARRHQILYRHIMHIWRRSIFPRNSTVWLNNWRSICWKYMNKAVHSASRPDVSCVGSAAWTIFHGEIQAWLCPCLHLKWSCTVFMYTCGVHERNEFKQGKTSYGRRSKIPSGWAVRNVMNLYRASINMCQGGHCLEI